MTPGTPEEDFQADLDQRRGIRYQNPAASARPNDDTGDPGGGGKMKKPDIEWLPSRVSARNFAFQRMPGAQCIRRV